MSFAAVPLIPSAPGAMTKIGGELDSVACEREGACDSRQLRSSAQNEDTRAYMVEGDEMDTVFSSQEAPVMRRLQQLLSQAVPSGGFVSGVFNLAGSSLGAGIIGLPYAFNLSGIAMGTVYLIAIFFLTVFSMNAIAIAAEKTGIRGYEAMSRSLFGHWGGVLTAGVMFAKCFGSCVAYVICVDDLITAIRKGSDPDAGKTPNYLLTSIVFVVLMMPLSLPKKINSLRYISLAGVMFIIYFSLCVIIHSVQNGMANGLKPELVFFRTGNQAVRGVGQFMFAYMCQSNVFEVWNEMKPAPNVRRLTYETFVSMLLCTTLYWLTGFFGYADFGPQVAASLLEMYHPMETPMMAVAYIGIVVKLCVAFALHILPCRDSVHHLIGWELETVAWWKNAVLCIAISGMSLLFGLLVSDVSVVFGLLGSFAGGFIAFLFPALFLMYSGGFNLQRVGWFYYIMTHTLLLCGVGVMVFGTGATIYTLV